MHTNNLVLVVEKRQEEECSIAQESRGLEQELQPLDDSALHLLNWRNSIHLRC